MIGDRAIHFSKLNAAGNDFICIDNTDGRFNPLIDNGLMVGFVHQLCNRGLGVGADGVILACQMGNGQGVDVVARFLEPDGSEARLCGNGMACFTYWLVAGRLLGGPEVTVLTGAGTATGRINADNPRRVRVCVPNPKDLRWNIVIDAAGSSWVVDHVDTGVPHAVVTVEDGLADLAVDQVGRAIRHHPAFEPDGVNANFVQILGVGQLAVRTFEFGVEAETLACGTGSAAAAILTALRQHWPREYLTGQRPVEVTVRSGATLLVWFEFGANGQVSDVCLETLVTPVYDGRLAEAFIADAAR